MRTRPLRLTALSLAAPVVLAACEFDSCTLSAEFAVHVRVRDSASDSVLLEGVRGSIREGSYVDSLRPHYEMPDVFAAGHERGGRYAVRVEVPGYTAWEELGVIVEESACLVHTADLVARLQQQS